MTDMAWSARARRRTLLIYVQFLILTLHAEAAVNDGLFSLPLSAVSRLNEPSIFFSFAAVTAMNILALIGCLPLCFFLQCKLEQQACLTGKDLSVMCTGFCPCASSTITETKHGKWPF